MTDDAHEIFGSFRDAYTELHRKIDDMEAMIQNLRTHVDFWRFSRAYEQVCALKNAANDFTELLLVPYSINRDYDEKRGGE